MSKRIQVKREDGRAARHAGYRHLAWPAQRGFTLAEAIIVIVITSIISAIVAIFIRSPMEGYVESAARADLTDVADTALRRMARDLRLALPNSIRISADGRFMELLLTKTGGRYLDSQDPMIPNGLILQFDTADTCESKPDVCRFTVVGPLPSGAQAISPGVDSIVVYNLGPGFAPADAYGNGNRALVTSVDVVNRSITMQSNPFAVQTTPMRSPTHRFQVVSTPVTYFCDSTESGGAGRLIRYWGYAIQETQPAEASANTPSAIIASGVARCDFSYESLANLRSALVGLQLKLVTPVLDAGKVQLIHQVHVDNTP